MLCQPQVTRVSSPLAAEFPRFPCFARLRRECTHSRGSSAVPNYVGRIHRAVACRCLSLVFAAGSSVRRVQSTVEIYRDRISPTFRVEIKPESSIQVTRQISKDDRIIIKCYVLFRFVVKAAVLPSLELICRGEMKVDYTVCWMGIPIRVHLPDD